MAKLTQKKVLWIIKQHLKSRTSKEISMALRISSSRVRQIVSYYTRFGRYPELKKPGRKQKEINPEIINTVLRAYNSYHLGPQSLEVKISRDYGVHIPHNTIYKIMMTNNLIKPNPRKRKRRKYIRYERKYSNELWHGDWKYVSVLNKWLVAFLDDASRVIVCYGLFDSPTTENTIKVLKRGFREFGIPDQIMTDHGSQFYANKKDKKGYSKSKFTEFLESKKIEHVLAGVKHPQSNGKIERWFGLVENKFDDWFGYNITKFVRWYNEVKPHMSLWFDSGETPIEAFRRKRKPEVIVGLFSKWTERC